MMVHPRVIALIAVLLLPCVPLAAADGATDEAFVFNHDHGETHPDGSVEMTGSSTLPLNDLTWELIDASTGVALVTGTYLDSVAPNADGSWSWSHNLSLVDSGCSCRFVVDLGAPDLQRHELVVFLGSGMSWSPVWLTQPIGDVVFTDADNRTVDLPIVLPPGRENGSVLEVERCPASSTGVCKSPPTLATFPLVTDGLSTTVVLNPLDWSPEGHWSVPSLVVIDNVLARSDSVQWHVLHDLTPPEVSIESASSANESDIVLVVVNATDSTSDLVELVELRATSPDGRVTVLDAGVNDSEFTVQPDSSGSWTVHVTVRDGAGLSQTASHVMQVSNLPPVAGVRLNGAMVEHGDAFQVKLGQPLLLDASTSSDTASDVLDLNHVWWIGDDVRLSGVERLTEDRFQNTGTFDVRMEVVDDDGAASELMFTLDVVDPDAPLGDAVVVGPVVILLIGVALVGVFLFRQRKDSTNIPTWPGEGET